jgi:hypothetical protein
MSMIFIIRLGYWISILKVSSIDHLFKERGGEPLPALYITRIRTRFVTCGMVWYI